MTPPYEGRVVGGPAQPVQIVGSDSPLDVNLELGDTISIAGTINNSETWRVALQSDTNISDSDKLFTVPANTEWQVISVWIEYASTATVGNRQLSVDFQNAAATPYASIKAGLTQAASLAYQYLFASGVQNMTALVGTYLSTQLPGMFLAPGFRIRVYDSAAIAVAADTMIVHILVAARSIA